MKFKLNFFPKKPFNNYGFAANNFKVIFLL
jgi:hypothetical protein